MIPNVYDYIGEITNMAWNLGYETTILDNNDLLFEHRSGNMYAPKIYGKFHTSNDEEEFWFNPVMEFPTDRLGMDDEGFTSVTKYWYEVSKLPERLLEASWYVEYEEE